MSATRDDISTTPSENRAANPPAETTTDDVEDEADQSPETLPLDQTFELLKNMRRRAVLQYLRESDEEVVSIGELAEHIAAVENDVDVDSVSSSQRKRAYVGLYQCHLPKMDDMNVIDFEKNRGEIARAENADQLERFLDHQPSADRPWYAYYAGLAAGSAVLLVLATLVGGAVGLTATIALAVLIAGLLVCAIVHSYEERSRQPIDVTATN